MLELHQCRNLILCQAFGFKTGEYSGVTLLSVAVIQLSLSAESYAFVICKSGGGPAGLDHELAQERGWRQKRVLTRSGLQRLLLLLTIRRSRGRLPASCCGEALGRVCYSITSDWASGLGWAKPRRIHR